jgi:GntR family transcriptional regulator
MPNTGDLPKYIQISELLIRDIQAGRLLDGERLPPERDMARSMGISVGTLRKALAVMTEKGLLERLQGSGNYIRRKEDQQSIYSFLHLELAEGGGLPTAEILSVDSMVKPADLPEFGSSDRGHRIRRFRRLSGKPAAIEEIWLDGSYIDQLRADQLSESLYYFYRNQLSLWIMRAVDFVGVAPVPDWTVPEFPHPAGFRVGFIERIATAQDGRTAEYSRTWFDPDTARYVARLK